MRINQSRNRRMFIMEEISMRQNSRQQARKSSAERRKKVENSLTDFMKTMSNVSYGGKTGGSQAFKFDHSSFQDNYYSEMNGQKNEVKEQYDRVLRSPSFKDINILEDQSIKDTQEVTKNLQKREQNRERQTQLEQQKVQRIEDEEIVYRQGVRDEEKLGVNSVMGNESSASAIFFTSQFNEFITKNHVQNNAQSAIDMPHRNDTSRNNTYEEKPLNSSQIQTPQKQNQQKQEQSHFQQLQKQPNLKSSQDQRQQKTQIPFHLNQKPQQNENSTNFVIQSKQILQQKLNEGEQLKLKQSDLLIHNKSNQSLTFSNQSSLKYSLNESNIKQIINQKFTHQLIAHSNHFNLHNQNSSLLHHLKLQILVDKFHLHSYKNTKKEFCSLAKLYQLSQKVIKRQIKTAFQAFIINQQLNLLERKNLIKSEKFLKQKEQQKFFKLFDTFKEQYHIKPFQKLQKAQKYYQDKQEQKIYKIFRCFKIVWFDQKVKKQIQLYYLSKLFSHFTRVIKKEKQIERKKYLSFYCFHLKKRYFNHLKEGVQNLQMQRIQRDNATCHYSFGLMRKVFDAWRQKLSYKDRYISLAMTTKNTFKQTSDQRWMQIKTVDFRQIK